MSVERKPHSLLDEMRENLAEWEGFGPVERVRAGDEYADLFLAHLLDLLEQFDALLQALHKIDGRNPPGAFIDTWGTVDIARRAIEPHVSNPASEPEAS